MGFKSTGCGNSSSSCSGGLTINRRESIDHSSDSRTNSTLLENDVVLDSCKTPMEQPECSNRMDCIQDDEFDESILEEIDGFCVQKFASKVERSVPSGDILAGTQHDSNRTCDPGASLDSTTVHDGVVKEGTPVSGSGLGPRENDSDTSQPTRTGDMPEECGKYLQSLNDRQREAACSDISIPLMIVAGPGSGKVPPHLSVFLQHSTMLFLIYLVYLINTIMFLPLFEMNFLLLISDFHNSWACVNAD